MLEGIGENRQRLVHALNGVLERDNSLSRCRAVRALADIGVREQATSGLLLTTLAGDPDADVRAEAALALGRVGGSEAVRPLLERVGGDPDGEVRIQAVIALAHLQDPNSVEALIHCVEQDGYPQLDDPADDMEYGACWEVHSQALRALGAIGDPRAVDTVIGLLEDGEYQDLHDAGFDVLAQLDDSRSRSFLLQRLQAGDPLDRRRAARVLAAVLETGSEEFQKALINALLDTDPMVRIEAARALSASSDPLAMVSITLLLSDSESQVRKEVVTLLGDKQGSAIVSRLHALLAESDPGLKSHVVRVLGSIASPESHKPLSELLATRDPDLLYEVVGALGKIARSGTQTAIAAILDDCEQPPALRAQAATALGRIIATLRRAKDDTREQTPVEPSNPETALRMAALDENDQVCLAALTALVEIDPTQASLILSEIVMGAGANLGITSGGDGIAAQSTAADEIAPKFDALILDASPETSTLAAILATAQVKEPETVAEAQEAAAPLKTPTARLAAARLLGGLARPGAAGLAALLSAAQAGDPDLRREALLALGRIGDEQSLDLFRNALAADSREVRLAALEGLARYGPLTKAAGWLEDLLTDPDPMVREHAVKTLVSLVGGGANALMTRALADDNLAVCRAALGALTPKDYGALTRQAILTLMFKFSGELRHEAAATLRRLNDLHSSDDLLALLHDPEREPHHWICIDALARMYANGTSVTH